MNGTDVSRTLLDPVRRRVVDALSLTAGRLPVYWTLVRRELETGSVGLPWRRRLWLWRHGFTSRSGALFTPEDGDHREYLSNLQHELADDVTEPWDALLNNKLAFYLLLGAYSEHLPELYGLVDGGELRRPSPGTAASVRTPSHVASSADESEGVDGLVETDRMEALAWIDGYLDGHDALVLKPVYGYGGGGVLVCRRDETGGYRVNGDPKTADEFAALLDDLEEYLAWAFAEQAGYAAELFPGSANTVRVVTMWDYQTDEPFVVGAFHRVGTSESAPVDNWSRGGLVAEVSDEGVLGRGARLDDAEYAAQREVTHPDTGARIEGTRVPGWPTVRDRIVEMAAELPYLPRIGWDVLVTGEGEFVVLEANAHAAMVELQVFRPLLRDPRVRRFYEHHGYA